MEIGVGQEGMLFFKIFMVLSRFISVYRQGAQCRNDNPRLRGGGGGWVRRFRIGPDSHVALS